MQVVEETCRQCVEMPGVWGVAVSHWRFEHGLLPSVAQQQRGIGTI